MKHGEGSASERSRTHPGGERDEGSGSPETPARFHSLQWRVFLFVAGSLTAVLLVFSAAHHFFLGAQIRAATVDQAEMVANTIVLSLGHAMNNKDRSAVEAALRDIVKNPALLESVIADPRGRVRFASRAALVGANLRDLPYNPARAHSKGDETSPGTVLYHVVPIRSRQECRACHPAGSEVLGSLGVAISTAGAADLMRLNGKFLVVLAVVVIALLFVLNYIFFSRYVLGPLGGLVERFRAVGEGSIEVPEGRSGSYRGEIGILHRRFDRMLAELRSIHQREMEKERELVALQSDRQYRAELEVMNEELGRRINDLDLANDRINRLALELEEKNRSLEKAVKNISALNRVGVALSSELDIDRLAQLLINISVKGLRVEIGQIMLVDERTGRLARSAWAGSDAPPEEEQEAGASSAVAKSGQALLLHQVDGSQGVAMETPQGYRRRSVLCVPIRRKDRLLGTIELTNKKGEEGFAEEDLEMLQSIANQAAVAIENAGLYREVQRSYLDTIRALVQAVEEKDRYTRGHSERVTAFSVKIARRLGLTPRQVQIVQYAGTLHDIGKIGIDLAILQKEGRLTEEEYSIVKRHPLIGERIIRPIGFLADVLPGVSQHHERCDGLGYPLGLCFDKLSIEARILAVADAYDAMITERPYRSPLSKESAVAELRRCSGTQFDPLVVEHFLELLQSDPEIHRLEEQVLSMTP